MPPRRRNYRRSRVEHPRGKPIQPHFFKIILHPTIRSNKLLISEEFVKEFGDELSSIAILSVPNGRTWRVGIQKVGENFWFRGGGWKKFVDYYSIGFGYCLVFRYEGNSKFDVMIFNNVSGYQIDYPCDEHDLGSDSDSDNDDDDVSIEIVGVEPLISKEARGKNCNIRHISSSKMNFESRSRKRECNMSRKGKQKVDETSSQRYFSLKQEVDEPFVPKSSSPTKIRSRNMELDDRFKNTIREASKHKLKNPSFMIPFKKHNRNYVYVRADFWSKYLRNTSESVTLEAPNGEQFLVNFCNNTSRGNGTRFLKGWPTFARINKLKEGDVCVFELINNRKTNILLKVWIYRSSV